MSTKRLSVVIDADTSRFDKSIKGMQGTMEKATGGIGGAFKKVGGAVGGLVGGIGKIAGAVGVFKLVDGAINMITSSIDGAISRVDTLNQFPRVLQQMGYSAEEANASTARLSEGIQGLPTTLDGIVGSTQRLVTIFGDVDLATESALALNNAFLASGASQADASRGLEQYTQMLSAGKVDMQSWRTLQETMPYALNETAKAFGFTGKSAQNDFYAALQDGEITFDEFNSKLIELSNETGGFAETALEASKGIDTSWQNVQTAVTTGVANIIKVFDEWLESAGFGGIAGVLDNIKVAVQDAFGAFAEWLPGAIDWVLELYNTLKDSTAFQIITDAMEGFRNKTDEVNDVIKRLSDFFREAFEAILEVALPILGVVVEGIQLYTGMITEYWEGVFSGDDGIVQSAINAFNAVIDIAIPILEDLAIFMGEILDKIATFWEENGEQIIQAVKNLWRIVSEIFIMLMEWLAPYIMQAWEQIKNIFNLALDVILGLIQIFSGIFTGDWEQIWEGVKTILSGAWDFITGYLEIVFGDIIDGAKEKWNGLKDFFSDTWDSISSTTTEVWESIKDYLTGLWTSITDSVREFFKPIVEFFTTLWKDVKAAFETGWENITNVLTVTWLFIEEMFGLLIDIIMIPWNFLWENFAEPLTETWESIKSYLSETLDTISNWISEKWNAIKDKTTEVWNQIKENIINPIKDAWNQLKAKVEEIKTGISNKWEEIKTDTQAKWNETKEKIVTPIKEAWNNLKAKVEEIKSGISTKWNEIKSDTQAKWNETKERIVTPITEAWNQLKAKVQEIKTGISTKWNEIKSDTQTKWNEVKTRITTPITEAWNSLKGKLNEIGSGVSGKWNEVKSLTTTKWNEIKSAITKPITDAWKKVKEMVDKIKGSMNFKWSLPKLKMPRFSISGSFSLNPPRVPSFGLSWYAKGGIATGPSVVGIGEAGDEAILPLSNKSKMQPFAHAVASMMPEFNGTGGGSGGDTVITGNTFVIREEADIKKIAQELRRLDDREAKGRGRIRL